MVKYWIIIFLTLSLSFPVMATSAKVYVWRNEKGVLVFSDSPKPGAEEVQLKPGNTAVPSMNVNTSLLDITPKVIEEKYEVIISQPMNNATIRDNTGSVYITGGIKPVFKRGYKIQLFVDGKAHQKPQTHSIFSLKNVDRGEHTLKMSLLDNTGKVIASSESTVFYMHRASVN